MGSLSGLGILVTRPAAQAEGLCEAIRARGGEPLLFPLIEIHPPDDPAPLADVAARLGAYDLAFFVSANAVDHAMPVLRAAGAWPARLRVATVGKGSEAALRRWGFEDVIAPDTGFDSEAVLALPAFQAAAVSGRRIVIFRGNGGRALLGEALRARGAEVEHVTCYRRSPPADGPAPLFAWFEKGALHAVILTSSEAVQHFVTLLGTRGLARFRNAPVFASHPRIAACAREAGFACVIQTDPGDMAIVHALESQLSGSLG